MTRCGVDRDGSSCPTSEVGECLSDRSDGLGVGVLDVGCEDSESQTRRTSFEPRKTRIVTCEGGRSGCNRGHTLEVETPGETTVGRGEGVKGPVGGTTLYCLFYKEE